MLAKWLRVLCKVLMKHEALVKLCRNSLEYLPAAGESAIALILSSYPIVCRLPEINRPQPEVQQHNCASS